MRPLIYLAGALASFAFFAPAPSAEAARCPAGYIYRPSLGVCQHRAKSIRYTRTKVARSEARRARIEARREARRARLAPARAKRAAIVAASSPAPAMPRTPMWETRDMQTFGAATVRPAWLADVTIFDSIHAQAWALSAERAAR